MMGEFYKMEYEVWDEATEEITLEEEGAFLRLCHQMYRRRSPVRDDLGVLSRLWRCHPNKARRILATLVDTGKIQRTQDGHLTQTRVTRELDARETLSIQRAEAGRTGGRRRADGRKKINYFNDSGQASATTHANQNQAEKRREEKNREEVEIEAQTVSSQNPSHDISDNFNALMREAAARPSSTPAAEQARPAHLQTETSPRARNGEEYAFIQGEVRITKPDLDRMKTTYPSINVVAELANLAEWDVVIDAGKNWWGPIRGALLKRERIEATAIRNAKIKAEAEAKAGIVQQNKSSRPAI